MRILFLAETLPIGGLANHLLDLARELGRAGHTVAVAHWAGIAIPPALDLSGVSLLPLPPMEVEEGGAARVLRRWAPDLVHVHLCSHLPLIGELQTLAVPLVRSYHDYTSLCLRKGRRRWPGDRCQRGLGPGCVVFGCAFGAPAPGSRLPERRPLGLKMAERDLYRDFDLGIVGSHAVRRALLANGFASERIRLVPLFSRFDTALADGLPLPAKRPGVPGVDRPMEFIFTGQAVAGKGMKLLMRALAKVEGDWRLTAIADGPDLPACKAIAERSGIAGRIDFKGWVPQGELGAYYREADLFVLPSVWDDPGPMVGIEAMSLETPVLGFPVGGIPDHVKDGVTGYLLPEVSVDALVTGLRRAMAHGAELADLGRGGHRLIQAVHNRRVHTATMIDLYRRLVDAWAGPGARKPQSAPQSPSHWAPVAAPLPRGAAAPTLPRTSEQG